MKEKILIVLVFIALLILCGEPAQDMKFASVVMMKSASLLVFGGSLIALDKKGKK